MTSDPARHEHRLHSAGSSELEAFGRLVVLHYPAVVAVAFATTRNLALSEDVAQDTFIAAWAARGTLRDLGRVRPWLSGIARNKSKNALRRYRREVAFDEHHEPTASTGGTPDDHMIDVAPSALDQRIARETGREVRVALARLPRAYREPLVLFYWQQQDIAQVASALAISEAAAQKRISRGRAYLKDGIGDKLEQIGAHKRSPAAVATAVLGVIATCTVARAAGAPGIATRLVPVAAKSLAVVALGAAAVVVGTAASRGHSRCTSACVTPTPPPPTTTPPEVAQRLNRLDRKLAVITFDDLDHSAGERQLEKRIALLEAAVHVAPRRRAPPTHAPDTQTRVAEPRTCDIVMCVFEEWKACTCCQELRRLNAGLDHASTVTWSISDDEDRASSPRR